MIENEVQQKITIEQMDRLVACQIKGETLTWIEKSQNEALQSLIDELFEELEDYKNR